MGDQFSSERVRGRYAPLTGGPGTPVYGRTILQMSGKEHSRKTAIVARRMRNPKILDAQIRRTVDRIAAQLLADIARHGGPLDLKACYTCPLPMKVITAMLAVPEGEQWLHRYEALAAGGVSSITGDLQARERALRLFPPVQALTRQALEAVEIAGQPIEAGEKLLILRVGKSR